MKWEFGSHPIPIGRKYRGFRVTRKNIKALYSIIKDKTLLEGGEVDELNLDFIEESSTSLGFHIKTGIHLVNGKPGTPSLEVANRNLMAALKNEKIDKGLIIAADEEDIHIPNTKDIRILSLMELKRNLNPFIPYLEKMVKDYEESEIHKLKCYIHLKGTNEDGTSFFTLDEYLLNWVIEPGKINQTTVLGDFGVGKSTTAKYLFWQQAKNFLDNPLTARIPIFISLRDYDRSFDMKTLVERSISEKITQMHITFQVVEELNKEGKILWILDGFDEMATRVNSKVMKDNFYEILKLAQPKSRILLTCRTHFFKNRDEVTNTLKGTELYEQLIQETDFQLLYVNPFSNEDIEKYVRLRLKDRAESFIKTLNENSQLKDLASRPLLLDMIIITLPKMIDQKITINTSNLYDQYTKLWLNRENWRVEMTVEQRIVFCQRLAWYFFTNSIYQIHYTKLPEFILDLFPKEISNKQELEFLTYDIQTTTFLNRDEAGNYSFIHKSFLEFFTASYILEELKRDRPEILDEKVLPPEIVAFLAEMIRNSPGLNEQLEVLSNTDKISLGNFWKRFLKPRIVPVLSKKNVRKDILSSYKGHLFRDSVIPLIVAFCIIGIIDSGIFYSNSFKYTLLALLFFPLIQLFLVSINFLVLTFRGRGGSPNLSFNILVVGYAAGLKIDTKLLEKKKDHVILDQRSVSNFTYKAIMGLPLGPQDVIVKKEKKSYGINIYLSLLKLNIPQSILALVAILLGHIIPMQSSGIKPKFLPYISPYFRLWGILLAALYFRALTSPVGQETMTFSFKNTDFFKLKVAGIFNIFWSIFFIFSFELIYLLLYSLKGQFLMPSYYYSFYQFMCFPIILIVLHMYLVHLFQRLISHAFPQKKLGLVIFSIQYLFGGILVLLMTLPLRIIEGIIPGNLILHFTSYLLGTGY